MWWALPFASLLTVALSLGLAASALAASGSGEISGTVIDALSKSPIKGIEVCAFPHSSGNESFACAKTHANGEYTIEGLASDEYEVEFFSPPESALNYVTQYYNGKANFTESNLVSVVSPGATPGIDAELSEGGRISGRVTDASTGAGISALVCFFRLNATFVGCGEAGANGEYISPPLANGEYSVEFFAGRNYVAQVYNGHSALSEANPVLVTVPNTTTGINVALQPAIVPAPPVNVTPPAISGAPAVGATLACANGLWTGTPPPSFTYRWLRDGTPIPGATESSYKIQGADEGHTLSCEVTARNSNGGKSAASAGVAVPAPPPPPPPPPPPSPLVKILGSKLVVSGKTLPVHIQCTNATCQGTIELTLQLVIKHHRGHRTTSRHETLVLAKGAYNLTQGTSANVKLRLTSTGRKRLAHVSKRHPFTGKLVLTLQGGAASTASVRVS
ncbi:MAG TPA: carboxypeptidase regulatory-like domain-containing protein [Solirubrobacteraceae bacterium]